VEWSELTDSSIPDAGWQEPDRFDYPHQARQPLTGDTLREVAIKVSQYFRDFLESDFKRQQAPRRQ
jgi:hypothetical protein